MEETPKYFPVEVQDIFNYLLDKYGGNNQICCILSLNGRINETLLQQSMRQSLDLEPILGCRFIEADANPFWQQREDLDSLELCSVLETCEVEAELQKFIGDRYIFSKDCQVKALILRAASDTLCLKINHACSNAGGFKQFLQLVALIYNNLLHNQSTAVPLHVLENRDQKQILDLVAAAPMVNDAHGGITLPPTVAFPYELGENTEQSFAVGQLDSKQFTAVKKYARENGVKINDVLLAAFNCALAAIAEIQDNTIMVKMTIDLRRYLPQGGTAPISNLSSTSLLSIHHDPMDSFESTLSKLSSETTKVKADHPGIKLARFLETKAGVSFKDTNNSFQQWQVQVQAAKNKLSTPTFSNLGIINNQAMKFGLLETTDCYLVGPALFAPNFVMVASTYANTLTLAANYFQSTISKQTVDQLMNTMLHTLRTCGESELVQLKLDFGTSDGDSTPPEAR